MSGGQQVGRARISGRAHASLWNGSASSWIDLHPTGAIQSECWDVDNGRQVGTTGDIEPRYRAALWSGTAASYVNLHPPIAVFSVAYGVEGNRQVGGATFVGATFGARIHAATWEGSAASFVDHHPTTPMLPESDPVVQSEFYGIRDGAIVGYYFTTPSPPFLMKAMKSAGSTIADMTPDIPPYVSEDTVCNAHMTSRGEHIGFMGPSLSDRKAVLWKGSPSTGIDLSPIGSVSSWGQGIWRGQQVGYAVFNNQRAGLWNGTAGSWVDLSVFLPASFTLSNARGIWSDPVNTYVVGWGTNSVTGRTEALLWTRASCWADLTHNEVVDDEDFSPFALAYDELICPAKLCPADLNDDGVVDDADFQLFVSAYDALLCP